MTDNPTTGTWDAAFDERSELQRPLIGRPVAGIDSAFNPGACGTGATSWSPKLEAALWHIDTRSCTCHPDDAPAVCQHKYALLDCRESAPEIPPRSLQDAMLFGTGVYLRSPNGDIEYVTPENMRAEPEIPVTAEMIEAARDTGLDCFDWSESALAEFYRAMRAKEPRTTGCWPVPNAAPESVHWLGQVHHGALFIERARWHGDRWTRWIDNRPTGDFANLCQAIYIGPTDDRNLIGLPTGWENVYGSAKPNDSGHTTEWHLRATIQERDTALARIAALEADNTDLKIDIECLSEALATQNQAVIDAGKLLAAVAEQPTDLDYHGPVKDGIAIPDPTHEQFHRSIGDVLAGKIIPAARRQMRDALDRPQPDAPTTASTSKPMPGRAVGLGA